MTQLAFSFKQINAKLPCNRIPTAAGAGREGSPRYIPYHGGVFWEGLIPAGSGLVAPMCTPGQGGWWWPCSVLPGHS